MRIEEIIFKFILALLIGGIIGYERENKNSPAGFRTHIVVCMGTTVISLIQLAMADNAINMVTRVPELADVIKVDYARLGAQAITGIGFLGAGTIIHSKGAIRGLTTAASLWVVGTLGLAIGMGYYNISLIGAIFIVITLVILKKFEKKFITKAGECVLEITYEKNEDSNKIVDFINTLYNKSGIKIMELELEDSCKGLSDAKYSVVKYTVLMPKYININDIVNKLILNDKIRNIRKL